MNAQATDFPHRSWLSLSRPVAGVLGGLVAGAAYLLGQVGLTGAIRQGAMAEPLQRIAAILLGPDAAPPPADLDFTIAGMALLIHFALAMVYGRVISEFVAGRRFGTGVLIGAITGLGLYVLNFYVLAPTAFPWFEGALRMVTAVDHLLFGAIAAATALVLQGSWPARRDSNPRPAA